MKINLSFPFRRTLECVTTPKSGLSSDNTETVKAQSPHSSFSHSCAYPASTFVYHMINTTGKLVRLHRNSAPEAQQVHSESTAWRQAVLLARILHHSSTETPQPKQLIHPSASEPFTFYHAHICHPKHLPTPTQTSTRNLPSTHWQHWQSRAATALLSSLLALISTSLILLHTSQINAMLL